MNGSDRLRDEAAKHIDRAQLLVKAMPSRSALYAELAVAQYLAADLGDALREAANYIRTEPYVSAWEQAGMQNKVDAVLARLDAWGQA